MAINEARWIATHQTPHHAPWLFPGAVGVGGRSKGQLHARSSYSFYLHRESPHPLEATRASSLLTGTAWHAVRHGGFNSSGAGRRVCAMPLTDAVVAGLVRCDCAPYAWGESCSVPVLPPPRRCVFNDSDPWVCHTPACIHAVGEVHTIGGMRRRCEGRPLALCPKSCSGRGSCGAGGSCTCFDGFAGESCERPTPARCFGGCSGRGICEGGFCRCDPPYWGIDCAHGPASAPAPPRCRSRPCVYVYELPARMHALARKAHGEWDVHGDLKYTAPLLLLDSLLISDHRALDAAEADLFLVPALDWNGCWGSNEGYYRAHRYIYTTFPFWNRSLGTDHVWLTARDMGSCETPWGSLREEMGASVVLTHWGGHTALDGVAHERCFRPRQDLVLPFAFNASRLRRSPVWDISGSAPSSPRRTLLFFFGALCWPTYVKAKTLEALQRKCNKSYRGGRGIHPVARYSFGLRYSIFRTHADTPGFNLVATDYTPSLPAAKLDVDSEMMSARFCLAPSGSGWGARAVHAVLMGCVPVLVQHDGVHPHVAQPFEPDLLEWEVFAVRVSLDEVGELPAILLRTNLTAKQLAMRRVWTRLAWRASLPEERKAQLRGPDAFESVMEVLRRRIRVGSI